MSLKRGLFAAIIASMILPLVPSLVSAQTGGGVPVTTGSPSSPFPQNKQNEPAVAIGFPLPAWRDPLKGEEFSDGRDAQEVR
jgi:hypothetical protein